MQKYFIFLIISLFQVCYNKFLRKTVKLSEFFRSERYMYLSKFGCEEGTCETKIQAKFKNPIIHQTKARYYVIRIGLKTDIEQQKDFQFKKCEQKQKNQVFFDHEFFLQIPTDSSLSQSTTIYYKNDKLNREVMTYFYFNDCQHYLESLDLFIEQEDFDKKDLRYNEIQFNILHLNSDKSNFSSEQSESIEFSLFFLIIQSMLLYYNYKQYKKDTEQNMVVNYPMFCLNISLLLDVFAHFLNLIHLIVFKHNGIGILLFFIGNNVFQNVSQYILSTIIVFIGCGWTIDIMDVEYIDDLALPMVLLFGFINVIIQALSHLAIDMKDNYHQFSSGGLIVMIFYKIIFISYFVYGTFKLYKRQTQRFRPFIIRFFIIGLISIVFQPILILMSYYVAVESKYKFVTYGYSIIQIQINLTLTYLLINKESIYNKISYKNQSVLDLKYD